MENNRIIVGVSGASGAPIAVELLHALRETRMESHLVVTPGGWRTIAEETGMTVNQVCALADVVHDVNDVGAPPASGSWRARGMVVVPCSMKTLAGIHSGYSDNLLLRAADVMLKERRKLVLMPRECPMSSIHLRNQYELSLMGAVILPPVLSYYSHPQSIKDMARHLVGKVLDQFDIEYDGFRRWGETNGNEN
ncbi:MAG: UbiX family flavin prenyltransferase [Oscillospiraceae bacterium]